jgi:hypothetical protein
MRGVMRVLFAFFILRICHSSPKRISKPGIWRELLGWVWSKLTTGKTGHFDFQNQPLMATPTVAATGAAVTAAGAAVTAAGATVAARLSTVAANAASIGNNAICATKAARRVFFDQSQIEVLAHSGQ